MSSFIKYTGCDEIEFLYCFNEEIGSGTFGIVHRVQSLEDGRYWAVKKTEKQDGNRIQFEAQILTTINHKNIIFVKEFIETDKYFFMVMELCMSGSLKHHWEKAGAFHEIEIQNLMLQFGKALSYLHNRNIAHRDLKMENILLQENALSGGINNGEINQDNRFMQYGLKLIDFGMSVRLKKNGEMMVGFCGTPMYMPPEIILGKSYSKLCDVWSMGIVMFALVTGKLPFKQSISLHNDILRFDALSKLPPKANLDFSSSCIQSLCSLLHLDPTYRLSASEFINLPWFVGNDNGERRTVNVLSLMKSMAQSNKSMSVPSCTGGSSR